MRGGREMADIAGKSNGYTRWRRETRNNVTSQFGRSSSPHRRLASVTGMSLKQRIPLLRWSVWRMVTGARNITTTGQIGDGREAAAVEYVLKHARAGDIDDVLATIDRFAYEKSMLINVGDEKGALLDAAVRRADPKLALELGTYCGYGALRIARASPGAEVYSVELAEANASNARQIWAHAGVADRVTCVVGTIGDGGHTLNALAGEHGFTAGALDFLFIDHDKNAYLVDLQSILDRGWLHSGSIVVADNVKVPGAPKYREYMRQQQGKLWRTAEHKAHAEYQSLISDLVLESEYLGG
jgi:catechol O-methyltransferase